MDDTRQTFVIPCTTAELQTLKQGQPDTVTDDSEVCRSARKEATTRKNMVGVTAICFLLDGKKTG